MKRVRGVGETPAGQVSTWLHEHGHPGTELNVSLPAGDVVLDDAEHPLVLVSAGIGITPSAAILEDLSRRSPGRTGRLFHADRAHDSHALYASLRRQVQAMDDAKAQNWYEMDAESAPTLHPALPGRMDLTEVELPDDAVVFMCGPLERRIARGIPAERISYEVFGPDLLGPAVRAGSRQTRPSSVRRRQHRQTSFEGERSAVSLLCLSRGAPRRE